MSPRAARVLSREAHAGTLRRAERLAAAGLAGRARETELAMNRGEGDHPRPRAAGCGTMTPVTATPVPATWARPTARSERADAGAIRDRRTWGPR
jgi:hypothetical protein